MSGHSKWATIHRKKGELDAARGKIFQKLAREIYVAAKGTDGNPDTNPSLRAVIEKAKGQNMPKDNIKNAIEKATKSNGGEEFENIRYEGYGPNGIAFMVDCLTDNRNRTASLVRAAFTKRGGNLGTDGSVSYMFSRKGLIVIPNELDEETVMMTVLDNKAEDFIANEDNYEIYSDPEDFLTVKKALEELGVKEFLTSEITYIASNKISLSEEDSEKVMNLTDVLEDIDDVQSVYNNLD
ncbi:MAG: YebC/PmpR family DNA-binding transcriptional regulator [Bacilli bacterium]|nr:YebC/PmpR family DNA-binding transcriptional regulator [Bacilli bacterium]